MPRPTGGSAAWSAGAGARGGASSTDRGGMSSRGGRVRQPLSRHLLSPPEAAAPRGGQQMRRRARRRRWARGRHAACHCAPRPQHRILSAVKAAAPTSLPRWPWQAWVWCGWIRQPLLRRRWSGAARRGQNAARRRAGSGEGRAARRGPAPSTSSGMQGGLLELRRASSVHTMAEFLELGRAPWRVSSSSVSRARPRHGGLLELGRIWWPWRGMCASGKGGRTIRRHLGCSRGRGAPLLSPN